MDKTWIMDLDDTLVHCQLYYNISIVSLMSFIVEKFRYAAPQIESVMDLRRKIDEKNLQEYGFSMKRFPTSLTMTLKQVSQDVAAKTGIEVKITEEDVKRVQGFAQAMFQDRQSV